MHNPLVNSTGDRPVERYNTAPTPLLAIFHQENEYLHANVIRRGWRPHWAKDRASPIKARVDEGGPKKQPYLICAEMARRSYTQPLGNFQTATKVRMSMMGSLSSPRTAPAG